MVRVCQGMVDSENWPSRFARQVWGHEDGRTVLWSSCYRAPALHWSDSKVRWKQSDFFTVVKPNLLQLWAVGENMALWLVAVRGEFVNKHKGSLFEYSSSLITFSTHWSHSSLSFRSLLNCEAFFRVENSLSILCSDTWGQWNVFLLLHFHVFLFFFFVVVWSDDDDDDDEKTRPNRWKKKGRKKTRNGFFVFVRLFPETAWSDPKGWWVFGIGGNRRDHRLDVRKEQLYQNEGEPAGKHVVERGRVPQRSTTFHAKGTGASIGVVSLLISFFFLCFSILRRLQTDSGT